jgi:TolA-binding protein
MRSKIIWPLFPYALGLTPAWAQTPKPTAPPAATAAATAAAIAAAKKGPRATSDQIIRGADESTKKSDHDLLVMIKGFRFLLKNEEPSPKRDHLLLANASAELALARNYRLRPKPTEEDKTNEHKFLEATYKDSYEILKSPTANQDSKSRGMYYSGLALIDLGRGKEAENLFTDAIRMKPTAEYAPSMALYLGEAKFDQELYKDAIVQYAQFFKRFNKSQKALSIYKTAWCYINLQKPDLAEKNFLLLAGKKWAGNFGTDSIADLAFVMGEHRSEPDILQYTAQVFPRESAIRTEVLTAVYKYYQSSSGTHEHPAMFAELMRIEKDPAKRLLLVISNLRGVQRNYAAMEPYRQFLDLKKRMQNDHVNPGSDVMKRVSPELEPIIEQLVRSYADTFSGKTKTPEKIERADMSKILIDLLWFHTTYFPKSEDRAASYETWMDVCRDLKDFACSYQVSRYVMKEPSLEKLHAHAKLEWLAALDGLKDTKPAYRAEYLQGLRQFHAEMPNDPQWLMLTKRLTILLNEDKNFKESIPVLKEIDDREKTTESRYRFLWALFEAQQFEDVTSAGASGNDKFAEDSKKLVREAHLRIASQKIEKNDFSGYEQHVNSYIAENGNNEKTEMVRRDYLNRSLDHGDVTRSNQYLLALPAEKRFNNQNKTLMNRTVDQYIKTGQFEPAHKLLVKGAKLGQYKDYEFDWYQTILGINRSLTKSEFQSVKDSNSKIQTYVIGVLTITHPEATMYYFQQQTTLNTKDKHLLLLSYQMSQQSWTPKLGPKARELLGNVAPADLKEADLSKSEQDIRKIQIPNEAVPEKRVAKIAEDTRQTRKRIQKDLEAAKSPKVQKRIILAAQALEESVGKMISDSPMPPNLTEEQQTAYKNGIQELANEFINQAAEYKKLSATLDQKVDGDDKERQRRIAKIDPASEVPSGDMKKVLEQLLDQKNFAGALVVIDRASSLNTIKPEEFHIYRSWILLTAHPTDFMKEYVRGELIEAKQDALLQKWEAK